MATVRGMTPEAIRALLRKELGDYQALSIAVNSAKGASESAIAEVENIRNDIKNMDFDFDDSKLDEAMEKFDKDMAELNEALDEVKTEALARENKLTALEKSLKQDRTKFNKEMQDMARELAESKTELDQKLAEASETLAANVTDVGERLSKELKNANKTISEGLVKDLDKLNTDLTEAFGKDLKSLETRQNSKTDSLDKALKDYKSKTDSKVSTLLSEIDKAKAFADGFLQPGNLVWNPMALDNARGIKTTSNSVKIESIQNTGKGSGEGLKVTIARKRGCSILYGDANRHGFELKNGQTFKFFAWIKSSVDLPSGSISPKAQHTPGANCGAIPANTWVKVEGEGTYTQNVDRYVVFEVYVAPSVPVGATIIIAEPYTIQKVTSDLIVDGAVTSKSLATGAVTAGKIAADAVTANNILAGAIGAKHIFAKAIGTDQLAANAVTAEKIVSGAIDADKIKAKSIGADQLAANAVTTEKLDANAVTAAKINAGAVTAQKIASKAINGDHIQANSIDTTKLTIMPGNLFPDPRFLDPVWNAGGNGTTSKYFGYENGYRIKALGLQTGSYYQPAGIPGDTAMSLEPGAAYRLTCRINFEGTTQPDRLDCYLRFVDKTKNSKSIQLIGGIKRTPSNTKVNNSYGMGELDFVYPDRAKDSLCTIGFFLQSSHKAGQVTITDVAIVRAADASLIVKGGIHADHIAANQITSKHISVDSIDGDRIKSNTLDADKIKANSLTSDHVKFKDSFITNSMIKNAEITDAKIKNLNAKKIDAGEMHGDRIRAGTLDANRIKANTLSANQIATGTLDAKRIGAGTITGDHIKANSISVGELRADAIIQSGMSLIPTEATGPNGALEPIWWNGLTKYSDPVYNGEPWYGTNKSLTPIPKTIMTKILPGVTYRVEFNIQASKAGSRIFIEMRDQNGAHAVESGAPNLQSKGKPKWPRVDKSQYIKKQLDYRESTTAGSNYLVDNFDVPTTPTNVVSYIKFKPGVTHVCLSRLYFNHSHGTVQDAAIRVNNLRVEADIPDQKEIDAKQDATIERLDKDADFLNEVLLNVARMLVRSEQNKSDSTFIHKGFSGTIIYGMFGAKVGTAYVELFVTPDWVGRIHFIANCSVGAFGGTPATWMTEVNSDQFKLYNASDAPSSPPSNFEHKGKFKYLKTDVRPGGSGTLDQVMMLIHHLPSFNEMFRLLTTKKITRQGMLEYGRSVGTPEPPMKETPPWERRGGLSSR